MFDRMAAKPANHDSTPWKPSGTPLSRYAAILIGLALLPIACTRWHGSASARPEVSARPGMASRPSAPAWALANTFDSSHATIIGVGSGDSLAEATRYALSDVAARLSISVEARLREVYREVDGTSTETLEHVLETRVLGTRFSNWERTRSVELGNVFWVEVQIDRQRLLRDSRVEMHEAADRVEQTLKDANRSALDRLLALKETAADQDRVSNLVALIDALQPAFDRDSWNQRRARWQAAQRSARRSLVFEVRGDRASQEIAHWLESKLANLQFATQAGQCENGDSVCIDIRSEVVEAELANRYVTRIRSIFSLLEPGGITLREIDLVGRGNSGSDPARAHRQAMDDLHENFDAARIVQSLIEL